MQSNNEHKLRLNTEAWHCDLMKSLEQHAMKKNNGKVETALILKAINEEKEISKNGTMYECIRSFFLPSGSADVILKMARFCLMPPLYINGIKDFHNIKFLPFETFSLYSLLLASYPRDTRTGRFHATIGNFYADGVSQKENDNEGILSNISYDSCHQLTLSQINLHRTFSGLGVVFMTETRMAIDKLMDDDKTMMQIYKEELLLSFLKDS